MFFAGAATAEFSDRGIIPRAIGAIFDHIENRFLAIGNRKSNKPNIVMIDFFSRRSDIKFTIRISYIEIYKGEGYDLLDPNHEPQRVQDLPKVTFVLNIIFIPTDESIQRTNRWSCRPTKEEK